MAKEVESGAPVVTVAGRHRVLCGQVMMIGCHVVFPSRDPVEAALLRDMHAAQHGQRCIFIRFAF